MGCLASGRAQHSHAPDALVGRADQSFFVLQVCDPIHQVSTGLAQVMVWGGGRVRDKKSKQYSATSFRSDFFSPPQYMKMSPSMRLHSFSTPANTVEME